jgi:OmpR-family two-component system manganese-sensing response regulator
MGVGVMAVADLALDREKGMAYFKGAPLYLSRKEYCLLCYFMANLGRVLSRQDILENVWDPEFDCFSNTLETHIRLLRKKIETPDSVKLIHTMFGRGYYFGLLDSQYGSE